MESLMTLLFAVGMLLLPLWIMLRLLFGVRGAREITVRLGHDFILWCIHRVFGWPQVRIARRRRKSHSRRR